MAGLPDTFLDWHIIIFVHQSTSLFYISSGSPLDSFDSLIDGKVQIHRKTSVEPGFEYLAIQPPCGPTS